MKQLSSLVLVALAVLFSASSASAGGETCGDGCVPTPEPCPVGCQVVKDPPAPADTATDEEDPAAKKAKILEGNIYSMRQRIAQLEANGASADDVEALKEQLGIMEDSLRALTAASNQEILDRAAGDRRTEEKMRELYDPLVSRMDANEQHDEFQDARLDAMSVQASKRWIRLSVQGGGFVLLLDGGRYSAFSVGPELKFRVSNVVSATLGGNVNLAASSRPWGASARFGLETRLGSLVSLRTGVEYLVGDVRRNAETAKVHAVLGDAGVALTVVRDFQLAAGVLAGVSYQKEGPSFAGGAVGSAIYTF
ncbi:MAG: hypothetical protein PHT12_03435 [Patescibacteria group bacterium]|nr:hypothetical protein [Patescibacteria group bacterium]